MNNGIFKECKQKNSEFRTKVYTICYYIIYAYIMYILYVIYVMPPASLMGKMT